MKHSYELCLLLVAARDRLYMISQVNDSHVTQCYDTRMYTLFKFQCVVRSTRCILSQAYLTHADQVI